MSKDEKTWVSASLVLLALVLVIMLLRRRKGTGVQTQTSVRIPELGDSAGFTGPTRDALNNALLRICSYDSGRTLTLDPNAVGGKCPPVYTSIDGTAGYLVTDNVITLPGTGAFRSPMPYSP